MLKLKKRPESPNWQIEGACPFTGEFVRKSAKTHSRDQASAILTAELNRRKEEALHGTQGAALFAHAVQEYIDKGGEQRFLEPLVDYFGAMPLRSIEDKQISEFCRSAYPDCAASTLVRQAYGPFQAVWNAASAARMCPERTWIKPKVKRAAVQYPRNDEWLLALMRDGLTTHAQRACAMFMSFSGRRATETANILVKHYSYARAEITIDKTKSGKGVVVALPPFVNEVLGRLDLRDANARLFGYATRWSIRNMIKRGCERAGIDYFSPHKMGRHRFAARFLQNGHSIKALQLAGGWDSIGAVNVYAHLESSAVHDAVRNVEVPKQLESLGRPTVTRE